MPRKVILWICPECGAKKSILSTQKEVTCGKCKTTWRKQVTIHWKRHEFHHRLPDGNLVRV